MGNKVEMSFCTEGGAKNTGSVPGKENPAKGKRNSAKQGSDKNYRSLAAFPEQYRGASVNPLKKSKGICEKTIKYMDK